VHHFLWETVCIDCQGILINSLTCNFTKNIVIKLIMKCSEDSADMRSWFNERFIVTCQNYKFNRYCCHSFCRDSSNEELERGNELQLFTLWLFTNLIAFCQYKVLTYCIIDL